MKCDLCGFKLDPYHGYVHEVDGPKRWHYECFDDLQEKDNNGSTEAGSN